MYVCITESLTVHQKLTQNVSHLIYNFIYTSVK